MNHIRKNLIRQLIRICEAFRHQLHDAPRIDNLVISQNKPIILKLQDAAVNMADISASLRHSVQADGNS